MDKIKRIKAKIFKSSKPSKPQKDRKLRHSLSMPLRSSSDTDDFETFGASCAVDVIDIKQAEQRYPNWPSTHEIDPNDFSRPYFPRRPYVEKNIIDKFPAPPTTVPDKPLPPKRPSTRPPTLDYSQILFDAHIPEYPKEAKAKIDAFDAAEAARNAAQLRARQRTPSSVTGQTQPLNIRRRGASSSSNMPPQQSEGMYQNHTASQSTRSLDPRARYRACLSSNRQAKAAPMHAHTASNSDGIIYSQSSAARSTSVLSTNARHRAATVSSSATQAIPALPSQQNYQSGSMRRRNASSASSRSVHALRRQGMVTNPGTVQYQEVLRAVRGPHAAQLQNPSVHTRADEHIGLSVNDTNSGKEWGAKSSRVIGGVATVAGYGRSVGVQRHY